MLCTKSEATQTEASTIDQHEVSVQTTLCVPLSGDDLCTVSMMYSKHCKDVLQLDVPENFLEYSISAMIRLKQNQRSNVVYNLAKGVGRERPDKTDARLKNAHGAHRARH